MADAKTADRSLDREFVVNGFLARLAIYRQKIDQGPGREYAMDRQERAQLCQEAIEWLATELGLEGDLKAAGYTFTDE